MTGSPQDNSLGMIQRLVLLVVALGLAVVLLVLRGGMQSESPMEQLARQSLEPQEALSNGRPTIVEFYADWCQVCREMAPAMLDLERRNRNSLDVVLINVDNPRWLDLVDRYDVNGIPQLNLFNASGDPIGRSLGLRTPEELKGLSEALIGNRALPSLPGVGELSALSTPTATTSAGPRSHG